MIVLVGHVQQSIPTPMHMNMGQYHDLVFVYDHSCVLQLTVQCTGLLLAFQIPVLAKHQYRGPKRPCSLTYCPQRTFAAAACTEHQLWTLFSSLVCRFHTSRLRHSTTEHQCGERKRSCSIGCCRGGRQVCALYKGPGTAVQGYLLYTAASDRRLWQRGLAIVLLLVLIESQTTAGCVR